MNLVALLAHQSSDYKEPWNHTNSQSVRLHLKTRAKPCSLRQVETKLCLHQIEQFQDEFAFQSKLPTIVTLFGEHKQLGNLCEECHYVSTVLNHPFLAKRYFAGAALKFQYSYSNQEK